MGLTTIGELLAAARREGITVEIEGELLRMKGGRLNSPIIKQIAQRKPEVIAYLSGSPQPDDEPEMGGDKQPRKRRLVANKPFPSQLLPDTLKLFVEAAATAIGCDLGFVASACLAALASTIGATRRVRVKPGWCEPSIIWVALVGPSGDKKSPSIDAAVSPLYDLQSHAFQEHARDIENHEVDLLNYEAELASWKRAKSKGEPPQRPERPNSCRYVVSDSTVEAISVILQSNPRGVLLCRDELDGWFGSFDRYASGRGSDIPAWLSIHNAKPIVVDRRTSGHVAVDCPAVSICGGVQPRILRKALRGRLLDSGLAARFLYVAPPRRICGWSDAVIPPRLTALYSELFDNLRSLERTTDRTAPVDLPLEGPALASFRSFVNENAAVRAGEGDELASVLSKLEAAAARIALVLQLVQDHRSESVSKQWLDAGVELANWYGREARKVLACLNESEDDDRDRNLAQWILAHGGHCTARELQQGRRDIPGAEDAHLTLKELASNGYGTYQIEQPPTGRPVYRFRLHEQQQLSTQAQPSELLETTSCVDDEEGVL